MEATKCHSKSRTYIPVPKPRRRNRNPALTRTHMYVTSTFTVYIGKNLPRNGQQRVMIFITGPKPVFAHFSAAEVHVVVIFGCSSYCLLVSYREQQQLRMTKKKRTGPELESTTAEISKMVDRLSSFRRRQGSRIKIKIKDDFDRSNFPNRMKEMNDWCKRKKIQMSIREKKDSIERSYTIKFVKCELFSGNIRIPESNKRRTFNNKLRQTVKYIVQHCMEDNMKAPMNNPAKSALLSKASFNIYFSPNKDKIDESEDAVVRTAYSFGTGASSIGLDPNYAKIRHLFPTMAELCNIVRGLVSDHYHKLKLDLNCDFDSVAVKLYFDNKTTNEHTDVIYDMETCQPKQDNSQMPGTPVAMVCFGNGKELGFTAHSRKYPKEILAAVSIPQKNNSITILDPRDEQISLTKEFFWKHSAKLIDGMDGVSMSLIFRVTQTTILVSPVTGNLKNPIMPGGEDGKKAQQFTRAWNALEKPKNKKVYEDAVDAVMQKVTRVLSLFWEEDKCGN